MKTEERGKGEKTRSSRGLGLKTQTQDGFLLFYLHVPSQTDNRNRDRNCRRWGGGSSTLAPKLEESSTCLLQGRPNGQDDKLSVDEQTGMGNRNGSVGEESEEERSWPVAVRVALPL